MHEVNMHESVLLKEAVDGLSVQQGGCYVDVTGGRGGHSQAILQELSEEGRLFIFDRDLTAVEELGKKFLKEERVEVIHAAFSEVFEILKSRNIKNVSGVLADLGVSSPQLDDPERGFSFRFNAPLDMRMDQSAALSAAEVVAQSTEEELADIFFYFGQERYSRKLARAIVHDRKLKPFETTQDLVGLIERVLGRYYRKVALHPATRVFQALRIFVNGELDQLGVLLDRAPEFLEPKGRLAIISFHSLEDRMVKKAFRQRGLKGFKVITKKPICPSDQEVEKNKRSRSAKLRILERES